jgi:hypothetical protein
MNLHRALILTVLGWRRVDLVLMLREVRVRMRVVEAVERRAMFDHELRRMRFVLLVLLVMDRDHWQPLVAVVRVQVVPANCRICRDHTRRRLLALSMGAGLAVEEASIVRALVVPMKEGAVEELAVRHLVVAEVVRLVWMMEELVEVQEVHHQV